MTQKLRETLLIIRRLIKKINKHYSGQKMVYSNRNDQCLIIKYIFLTSE